MEKLKFSDFQYVQADPVRKTTDIVARIEIHNWDVCVLSEKDDIIIQVCKDYGLKFDWNVRNWKLAVRPSMSESIEDRAIELGNRMLNAGVPVVMRKPLLDRAVSGDFEPYTKRWITTIANDRVFRIKVDGDDTYQAAKLLPKAKYENHGFSVPYSSWRDVEDFGTLLGYKCSDGARKAFEEQRALADTKIVVEPAVVVRKEKKLSDALSEVLESSRDVLEDLIDDD